MRPCRGESDGREHRYCCLETCPDAALNDEMTGFSSPGLPALRGVGHSRPSRKPPSCSRLSRKAAVHLERQEEWRCLRCHPAVHPGLVIKGVGQRRGPQKRGNFGSWEPLVKIR